MAAVAIANTVHMSEGFGSELPPWWFFVDDAGDVMPQKMSDSNYDRNNNSSDSSKQQRRALHLSLDAQQYEHQQLLLHKEKQQQAKQQSQQQPYQQQQLQLQNRQQQQRQQEAATASLSIMLDLANLDTSSRKRAFVSLCKKNKQLLSNSRVFDGYLLAVAFVYFQRVGLSIWKYSSDKLFAALYLAAANIEDSEEGKHELLCYRVGVSHQFPELGYTNVRKRAKYDDHTRWKEDIKKFHGKVYKLWSMLDYKAHVSWVVTANVMSSFANCTNTSGVFRLRAPEDLKLLAPFF